MQNQRLSGSGIVQNETPSTHLWFQGNGCPLRCLSLHPHPPTSTEVSFVHAQVSNLPVHLSSLQVCFGITSLHRDCERSESDFTSS